LRLRTTASVHPAVPTSIRPQGPNAAMAWREVRGSMDLLFSLLLRDWKVRYAPTRLGWLWALLQPAASIMVIGWVFGRFRMPQGGVSSLVYLSSTWALWQYFSTVVVQSSQVYVQNAALIKKVHFPRVVLPLSKVLGALPELVLGLLVGMGIAATQTPFQGVWLASLPLSVGMALLCSAGLALVVAHVGALWRDLGFGLPALVQLLFFISPVAFGAQRLKGIPGVVWNPLLPALDVQHRLWFGPHTQLGHGEALWVAGLLLVAGAVGSWKLGPQLGARL